MSDAGATFGDKRYARGAAVEEIVNMAAIAVIQAQMGARTEKLRAPVPVKAA